MTLKSISNTYCTNYATIKKRQSQPFTLFTVATGWWWGWLWGGLINNTSTLFPPAEFSTYS